MREIHTVMRLRYFFANSELGTCIFILTLSRIKFLSILFFGEVNMRKTTKLKILKNYLAKFLFFYVHQNSHYLDYSIMAL